MKASDLLSQSLIEQRDAVASGQITSQELTEAYIARIKELNPELNIVIRRNFAR